MCERPGSARRWLLAGTLLALAGADAALGGHRAGAQNFERLERGRYLATVADCIGCHTDPALPEPYAGGRPIETPFGVVAAANITPDLETGIGAWSDQAFDDAVRRGRRLDGQRLYPAMPFPYYAKMSSEDVLAIRAYLDTIAPVHRTVRSNQLPFPLNIRAGMRLWDALYFDGRTFRPDASKSATWNRGAYLVEGPGHCGACHTPKTWLGGDESRQFLRGYSIQGWYAPDLTADPARGLGAWQDSDVIAYLKRGHNQYSGAGGPMGEEIANSSSQMRDEDLAAITTYLRDLPAGSAEQTRALAADDPRMQAGGAIYQDLCSACHGPDGHGVAFLIPSLAGSPAVASREPTSALQVLIRGARSVATAQEPTAPAMPSFGWQLTDAQIAAVVTYVRNSFGHTASPVSVDEVRKARTKLTPRSD
jgi:mono/diheme cytochrome c family protein